MTSKACKHTESLISFSLSLFQCVSKSLSAEIYPLSHTHRGERSTLRTSSFWASPYGFSSSVGSAWSSEKCLAALLHDFLCAHQFDPNGWTAGISPSWRQLLLEFISLADILLQSCWKVLCYFPFFPFCLMKRILKCNQRAFIISG